MALDAIILDIDGTLLDTNDYHVEAWRRAFERFGFTIRPDRIEVEIGKGGDQLVPSILGQEVNREQGEELRKASAEEFLAIAAREQFHPFPGAVEMMKNLRQRGLRLALATSSSTEHLKAMEKSSGVPLRDMVDEVITADDANASKPAPDLVIAACGKLGLAPGQCAMLGDTIYDAEACRKAGVVLLGLRSGYNTDRALIGAGARGVWSDTRDLLNHLDAALELAAPGEAHLTQELMEELMRRALEVARDGMKAGEAPIGCVLARGDGLVVATGYNEMQRTGSRIAHAEIVAFTNAAGKVPRDARDLLLVSTLQPCVMCTGAAMQGAVDAIIYGLRAPADSGTGRVRPPESPENQMPKIIGDILRDESRLLFKEWLERCADRGEADEQVEYVRQLLALT